MRKYKTSWLVGMTAWFLAIAVSFSKNWVAGVLVALGGVAFVITYTSTIIGREADETADRLFQEMVDRKKAVSAKEEA